MSVIKGYADLLKILNTVQVAEAFETKQELKSSIYRIMEVLYPGDTKFNYKTKQFEYARDKDVAPGIGYRKNLDNKVSIVTVTKEALLVNVPYASNNIKKFEDDLNEFIASLKKVIGTTRHVKDLEALKHKLEGEPDPKNPNKYKVQPYNISRGSLLVLEPLTIVAASFNTLRSIISDTSKGVKHTNEYFGTGSVYVRWQQLLRRQERGTILTALDFCNKSSWVASIRKNLPEDANTPQILVDLGNNDYAISAEFAELAGQVGKKVDSDKSKSKLPEYKSIEEALTGSDSAYIRSGRRLAGAWIQQRSVIDIGHMFIPDTLSFSTPLTDKLKEIALNKKNLFSAESVKEAKEALGYLAAAHATFGIGSTGVAPTTKVTSTISNISSSSASVKPPTDGLSVASIVAEYHNKGINSNSQLVDGNVLNLTLHYLDLNNDIATKHEGPKYEAVVKQIFAGIATKVSTKAQHLVQVAGSNTLEEDIAQSIEQVLAGKVGKVQGHSPIKAVLSIYGKSTVNRTKSKPAARPSPNTYSGGKSTTTIKKGNSALGPKPAQAVPKTPVGTVIPAPQIISNLQQLLNANLAQKIRENMGGGTSKRVLNNRTGRFADSVKVERMSESRAGMITAFYSYMKNPYATFSEGGRQQYPKTRDPKLLISKSIRELAGTAVTNRMRAVLA